MKKVLALVAALAMLLSLSLGAHATLGNVPVNPEDRCLECMVDGNPRKRYVPGLPLEDTAGNWRTHPPIDHWMPYHDFRAFDFGGGFHLISRGEIVWIPGWNPYNQYTNGEVQGFSEWFHWDGNNHYDGTWWVTWPDQLRDAMVTPRRVEWADASHPGPPAIAAGVNRWWIQVGTCTPSTCTNPVPDENCNSLWELWEVQTRLPDWGPYQGWIYFRTHGGWILGPGHWEFYCACDEEPVNDVPVNDVPVNDVPVNDVPVNDVPVNDVPVNDVPVNDGGCECCDCCEACDCDECCDCCEECPAPPTPPTPPGAAPVTGDVASAATSAPLMIASVLALLTLSGGALLKRKK